MLQILLTLQNVREKIITFCSCFRDFKKLRNLSILFFYSFHLIELMLSNQNIFSLFLVFHPVVIQAETSATVLQAL